MSKSPKKVLVTGGAGYIGSHTSVALAEAGYLPVVVDNFCASDRRILARMRELIGADFPVHELDCRDREALARVFEREAPLFGVIHFAAHKSVGVSVRQPREYYDNNVGSLLALLWVLERAGVPALVFSSSCTVYGQPEALPVTEHSPLQRAASPYGRTKQICEDLIQDVVASGGALRAVSLRYFNPIGAHPSAKIGELPLGTPETLAPYLVQTAAGLRDELVVFGNDYATPDGSCVRDYLHICDLASAHVAAFDWIAREPRAVFHEIFNVGTGQGTSVLEAIRAFEAATGVPLRYRIGPRRPGDAAAVYASVDKAERVLGWRARLSIREALRDAWRWQQSLQNGL
ncbi:MAG TPA: UDP-glucose 4-epimerase GalE [Polyangiaceae bacterium]|nr:UDP-glucose 4-epimerase GalE [Polyangiaceae bacterium]